MKKLLIIICTSSFLFSIEGIIIFNDQTTIEGNINGIEKNSVYITPVGLTFPEQILLENIDSLKINDGTIPIAGGEVLLLYQNGEFFSPKKPGTNNQSDLSQFVIEYVIVPNWSLNFYTGYPIIKGATFKDFDDSSPVYGLSIGSPYGFFAGDFFMNAIAEIAYYDHGVTTDPDTSFGGFCYQLGLSPGFFIGNTSYSVTACTGFYRDDARKFSSGFIAGGSIDIPVGQMVLKHFSNVEIFKSLNDLFDQFTDFKILEGVKVKDYRENLEAFEMRITTRSNLIEKVDGMTYWIGAGFSFGYEF